MGWDPWDPTWDRNTVRRIFPPLVRRRTYDPTVGSYYNNITSRRSTIDIRIYDRNYKMVFSNF